MVLKKSKHDLNTGNTLRNHGLETFRFTRGLMECRVDSVRLDQVRNSLYDANCDYEQLHALNQLERVLYILEKMNIDSSMSLEYSLSKRSRWSSVEVLSSHLYYLNELARTMSSLGIVIHEVKHLDSFECQIIPLQPLTVWTKEKTTSIRKHDRGIQRISLAKTSRSDRGDSTKMNDQADVKCCTWETGLKSRLLSRQPKAGCKVETRPKIKGSKRNAIDWQEDMVGFRGCSATELYRHEMGYGYSWPPGFERKSTTHKNKWTTSRNDSSRNRIFLTECTEKNIKKTTTKPRAKPEEDVAAASRDNQLMLWQFVNVLVNDSVSSSVTVTFKNCKRSSKCSRKEMKVAKMKTLDSYSELKNKNRTNHPEESEQPLTKWQLKKKNKANNMVPILPSDSDSRQSVLLKVKSSDLMSEFLRQNYSYRFCEAACLPRAFWINISDNPPSSGVDVLGSVATKSEPTRTESVSITNLSCFHDFSCLLLFTESLNPVSQDSFPSQPLSPKSRPSSAKLSESRLPSASKIRHMKSSHSLVSLEMKMLVKSSSLEKVYVRLEELLPSGVIHSIVDIVNCVTLVIKDMDAELRLEAENALGCCQSVGDSSFCRLDWMKSSCQWQFDIYEPSIYSTMLTKRVLSASPRNVLSKRSKHSGVDKELCALCHCQLTANSRHYSSKSRDLNLIPVNDGRHSATKLDVRVLANCHHCVCVNCLRTAMKDKLKKGDVLEVCPVEGCLTELDLPTLLSVVPLSVFRSHLQTSLDQKIRLYPQWKRCPNKLCHRAVRLSGACILQKTVSIVCRCGTAWCFHCLKDSHWPALCSEYAVYRQYQAKEGIESCNPIYTVMLGKPIEDLRLQSAESSSARTLATRNVFSATKLPNISSVSVTLSSTDTEHNRTGKPYDWLLNAKIEIGHLPMNSSPLSRVPARARLLPLPSVPLKPFKCGLPNNSASRRSSDSAEKKRRQLPELIQRHSTELMSFDCTKYSSSEWELCLRCVDLNDTVLSLPIDYMEHRTQPATQVKSALIPLLVYRSALNHRSVRLTWNQPAVEHLAKLRATQIVNAQQTRGRHLFSATRLSGGGSVESSPMPLSTSGLDVPTLSRDAGHKVKVETKAVLIIFAQQFVMEAHTLLENVCVAVFNKWRQPDVVEQLLMALRLEDIVASIIKLLDVTARCPRNFSSKLQKLVAEGRNLLLQLVSTCAGLQPVSTSLVVDLSPR